MSSASRLAAALIAAGLVGVAGASRAEIAWDPQFYDPQPAEDGHDFILPMPCGGAMAFRRIETPVPMDWLMDQQIRLGSPAEDELSYAEYLRTEYIVGSLTDESSRFFYIGKYEVTTHQWKSVMGDACPEPSMPGRVAMGGLTWFEGIDFTRRYTEWLLQNAADDLPHEEGEPAFLRLPLETEWEYVARGGSAVTPLDFRRTVFPMDGSLADYAWYQGADSAGGSMRPVGLLSANPLGVYDVLGNAEEFVMDPFRMNRAGRSHGQAGGFLTKGGSILTAGSRMRTAMRTEYNYFDERSGSATRLPTFGLRLVIAAPVSTSTARLEAIRESWEDVPRARLETDGLDPIEALGELAGFAEDAVIGENLSRIEAELRDQESALQQEQAELAEREAELRDQVAGMADAFAEIQTALREELAIRDAMADTLSDIQGSLREELAARNEAESRAVSALIYAGAVMMRKTRDDNRRWATLQRALELASSLDQSVLENRQQAENLQQLVAAARQNFQISRNAYFYLLIETGETYTAEQLQQQVSVVRQVFEQLGESDTPMDPFIAFAELFTDQAVAYGATGDFDEEATIQQILEL